MKITELQAYKRIEEMFEKKGYSRWIKDDMPDISEYADKYKDIFNKAKEDVKNIIPSLKNNPDKDKPLGDEDKKFKF